MEKLELLVRSSLEEYLKSPDLNEEKYNEYIFWSKELYEMSKFNLGEI